MDLDKCKRYLEQVENQNRFLAEQISRLLSENLALRKLLHFFPEPENTCPDLPAVVESRS